VGQAFSRRAGIMTDWKVGPTQGGWVFPGAE